MTRVSPISPTARLLGEKTPEAVNDHSGARHTCSQEERTFSAGASRRECGPVRAPDEPLSTQPANSAQSELNAVSPSRHSCYYCDSCPSVRARAETINAVREYPVNQAADQTIFLIGYRGTGKSTVARLLAEHLGWRWADADALLETRFGRSIRSIFDEEGEAGFRTKESAVLDELCRLKKHVIATGGGVVLRAGNRAKLKAAGRIVWLTADAQTIWNRLQSDATSAQRRPALTSGGLNEVIELLQAREPHYADCADITVDTAGRTPAEIVAAIVKQLSMEPTANPRAKS